MDNLVLGVARQFGFEGTSVESLTEGLIHRTYKVVQGNRTVILQQINTDVFADPNKIIQNYQLLYQHLDLRDGIKIPQLKKTVSGNELLHEGKFCWRAFGFIPNSYTENLPTTKEKIYSAAQCYGAFVNSLHDLDSEKLQPTIVGFHDLNNRYNQLQLAIQSATQERLIQSERWLQKIELRKALVTFYNDAIQNPEFKVRAMHHDCKLSNILFDKTTKQALCPIDLDTVMPGYFFSDMGDMVRSMTSETAEDSSPENITIRKEFYDAILRGYLSGVGKTFTKAELDHIHHAGLIMIYMQAIRFLADFLSNDVYYKISYPSQNFERAVNQLALLEKLEEFLEAEYRYNVK